MERKQNLTYLFDFDGTLVDSMPTFVSAMLGLLDKAHIPYGEDIVKIITPLGYGGTARYFRTLGLDIPEEDMVREMKRFALDAYLHTIPEKAGVTEALRVLYERGDSLNILTASPHEALDACLERLGILPLFQNVWSCEDFGTTKADPAIYRMAAERIGVPVGEVIFVDDNLLAVKTAAEAGMRAFGIYDATSAELRPEIEAVAERYLLRLDDLLEKSPST